MSKNNSIRQQLGQNFFIGFKGLELPETVAKFIAENHIGGVTLFSNNYESPAQVAELITQIQESRKTELPLMICVDHEGGRVQRFKKGFTKFPEAMVIANENSPKLIFECAAAMARELRAVGVTVNFAPVADINTNPKNPVIGTRAFGETEEMVSKMVSAFVRGHLKEGVHCVVKHFPGHGDTKVDSHFHLPRVKTSLEILRKRELLPFQKAFKSKCEMVMTAHIILDELNKNLPATLNPNIIEDLLRKELRFKGIIFSDDMEMKAIADHFGVSEAPLMAIEAGVTALLYHTEEFQRHAFEGACALLESGKYPEALKKLSAANKLITEFKAKHNPTWKRINIDEIETLLQNPEHISLAASLEKLTQTNPFIYSGSTPE